MTEQELAELVSQIRAQLKLVADLMADVQAEVHQIEQMVLGDLDAQFAQRVDYTSDEVIDLFRRRP